MNGPIRKELYTTTITPADDHLVLENVTKNFTSDRGSIEALRGVSLRFRKGEFVSIVGPSGCGKSTLLRCIAGLDRPTEGEVRLKGELVNEPLPNMGIVFQRDVLMDWRTVLDNVLLVAELRGVPRRDKIPRAKELLHIFGLSGFQDRYPWELSGGMRQRVSICRAVLEDPDLLLMDEPFAALDAFTRDDLNLELQQTSLRTGSTTVFITHSIPEAVFLADRVVIMDRRPGRVALMLEINIPKPRSLAVRESAVFLDYGRKIRTTFEELGIVRRAP